MSFKKDYTQNIIRFTLSLLLLLTTTFVIIPHAEATPTIDLSLNEGYSGDIITVNGVEFTPDEIISLGIPDSSPTTGIALTNGIDSWGCIIINNPIVVDPDGEFSFEWIVPDTGTTGTFDLQVSDGVILAETTFTVLGLPEITLTPDNGIQGSPITIDGSNFPDLLGFDVELGLFQADLLVTDIITLETSSIGTLDDTFTIPAVPDGIYQIKAYAPNPPEINSINEWNLDAVSILQIGTVPVIIVPDDYLTIQAAIDAANPYDEILIREGVYYESLEIVKPLTLTAAGNDDVYIDGEGASTVIDVQSKDVVLENLLVQNGDDGIALMGADNAIIEGCIIALCSDHGIISECSYDIWITFTAVDQCAWGVYLYFSDRAWIHGVESDNHEYVGLLIAFSEDVWISDCGCENNEVSGIELHYSDNAVIDTTESVSNSNGLVAIECRDLSVCTSICAENMNGFAFENCDKVYMSKCESSSNNIGLIVYDSSLTAVNSDIYSNTDCGIDVKRSNPVLRYCSITDNPLGVNTYLSLVDAQDCWWGHPTGPYDPLYNPGGLGDEVEDVEYTPWQTVLYQPEVLISDFKCQQLTHWWTAIYPSENTEKPLETAPAMVSDWLASAYVTTKLDSCDEGLDVDPSFVDPVTGNNMALSGECVLSFGGPVVNPVVKYAEQEITPSGDRAPLKYVGEGGINYFKHWDDAVIPDANLPNSVINNDQDMFLIERYVDNQGRIMMLCYGFGWQGTYAAGKYFESNIFPDLDSFYYSWVIVKWEDTNSDGFVNNPNVDDYTLIDAG